MKKPEIKALQQPPDSVSFSHHNHTGVADFLDIKLLPETERSKNDQWFWFLSNMQNSAARLSGLFSCFTSDIIKIPPDLHSKI